MWTLAYGQHEGTRAAAMAAFAKSWRRQVPRRTSLFWRLCLDHTPDQPRQKPPPREARGPEDYKSREGG
jgi:hypothetical protein